MSSYLRSFPEAHLEREAGVSFSSLQRTPHCDSLCLLCRSQEVGIRTVGAEPDFPVLSHLPFALECALEQEELLLASHYKRVFFFFCLFWAFGNKMSNHIEL